MFTDKNGNEITIKDILQHLVGTDELDMAKSVIDFGLYDVKEDKTLGEMHYYLVAAEAIVSGISFMGPFTMLEIDFRNVGIGIMKEVMDIVKKFHQEINDKELILLSSITSLEEDAKYVLSLINPLTCVRGFVSETEGTTLMQLIYSTENIAFTEYEVDFEQIRAELGREAAELERIQVTEEEIAEEQEKIDELGMNEMFKPEFGIRDVQEKYQTEEGTRISGKQGVKVRSKDDIKERENQVTSIHQQEEEE